MIQPNHRMDDKLEQELRLSLLQEFIKELRDEGARELEKELKKCNSIVFKEVAKGLWPTIPKFGNSLIKRSQIITKRPVCWLIFKVTGVLLVGSLLAWATGHPEILLTLAPIVAMLIDISFLSENVKQVTSNAFEKKVWACVNAMKEQISKDETQGSVV